MIESELQQPMSPLGTLLEHMIGGQPITRQTITQMAADAVSRIVGRPVTIEEIRQSGERMGLDVDGINVELSWENIRAQASDLYSRASSRVRSGSTIDPEERARRKAEQEAQRQQNREARAKAGEISRARRVLGFTAKEPVTREQVKARQRELARKHHPDRGGSVERMQQINWAVDILLRPA